MKLVPKVAVALAASAFIVGLNAQAISATTPGCAGLIAFISDRDGFGIYTMKPNGTDVHKLTSFSAGSEGTGEPKWSPDGSRIVFSQNSGAGDHDIFTVTTNGTLRQITSGPADDRTPAWAPDGRHIVFSSQRDISYDLYVMGLHSNHAPTNITRTPTSDEWSPDWSPNGRWIAYDRYSDGAGTQDVWRLDVASQVPVNLTPLTDGSFDGAANWSPDSAQIAFHSTRDGGVNNIFVMRRDGGQVSPLTSGGSFAGPVWSPKQDRIAFFEQPANIYLMRSDGSDMRLILQNSAPNGWVGWQPLSKGCARR